MEATKDHISLETAKLLKDCGVDSKLCFFKGTCKNLRILSDVDMRMSETEFVNDNESWSYEKYPAFTWGEIEENAEKFFGNEIIENNPQDDEDLPGIKECGHLYGTCSFLAKAWHCLKLTEYRLNREYAEADEYFRKHCILIKK